MDDIVVTAPQDKIESILCKFNAYYERIKFIVEYDDKNGISFLDVRLIIEERKLIFYIFKKAYQF